MKKPLKFKWKPRFPEHMPKWLRRTIVIVLCVAVGGGAVFGALFLVRSGGGAVNVYKVQELSTSSGSVDQAETSGAVTPDRIQSVYVSSTQKITEIFVEEGDTVHVGDPLLAFDTTLTDLELERQRITVQKLQLDLEDAQKELARINTYRVYVPPADTGGGEDEPSEDLPALSLPYLQQGSGTSLDPFVYVWNDQCAYDQTFINSILSPLPEGYVPGTDPRPTVYAIFEVREGDSLAGSILREWEIIFWRTDSGGYEFSIQAPVRGGGSGEGGDGGDGEGGEDVVMPPVDTNVYYSWNEIISMRQEAQKKITNLELDIKKAQLQLETLEYELNNGMVYSKIDGVVKTVRDPEQALSENNPVVLVSGGGGYYIQGAMSELELGYLQVGDTVNVMSWESYSQVEAVITEISEYPVSSDNGSFYHYSSGNQNVSLYPFTVFVDEDANLREGEWVNITYNPFGNTGTGLFLQNAFIRMENGKSYVYAMNGSGRLVRHEVVTGRNLWGSYTEILSGLAPDNYIAFPYGRAVRDGAKTQVADLDALYSGY